MIINKFIFFDKGQSILDICNVEVVAFVIESNEPHRPTLQSLIVILSWTIISYKPDEHVVMLVQQVIRQHLAITSKQLPPQL